MRTPQLTRLANDDESAFLIYLGAYHVAARRAVSIRSLSAFSDHQSDVVVLLGAAEALDVMNDLREQRLRRQTAPAAESLDQALLSVLFARRIEGFRDSIGEERKDVSGRKLPLLD